MTRIIICSRCNELKPNVGRGLCGKCYYHVRWHTEPAFRERVLERARNRTSLNRSRTEYLLSLSVDDLLEHIRNLDYEDDDNHA